MRCVSPGNPCKQSAKVIAPGLTDNGLPTADHPSQTQQKRKVPFQASYYTPRNFQVAEGSDARCISCSRIPGATTGSAAGTVLGSTLDPSASTLAEQRTGIFLDIHQTREESPLAGPPLATAVVVMC